MKKIIVEELLNDVNVTLNYKCDYIDESFPSMVKETNKARQELNSAINTLSKLNSEFDKVIIINLNNKITSNGKQGMNCLKQIYNTIDKNNKSHMEQFTNLYKELTKLNKLVATTVEEKQDKLDKIMVINGQIDEFFNEIGAKKRLRHLSKCIKELVSN